MTREWVCIVSFPGERDWALIIKAPVDYTETLVYARVIRFFRGTATLRIVIHGGTTLAID